MKKILILLFALLAFLPLNVKADSLFDNLDEPASAINKGNLIVDIGAGGEYFSYGAHQAGIKTGSFLMNLRALYAVEPALNIGLEGIFGRGGMGGGTAIPYDSGYDLYSNVRKEDNYHNTWAVMFASRLNFNPQDTNRFYMPLGVGYMEMDQITEYKAYSFVFPGQTYEFKEDRKLGGGVAFYGGLGWEYDFSNIIIGLESRFTMFKCGGQFINGISLLARFGIKL